MAEPFLGEIKIFAFNFPPKGYAMCNGQILPINQNQALFALLGTTYGGNGTTTFQLPNFQGRSPMHVGNNHTLGQIGGQSTETLIINEMPSHSHQVNGYSTAGNSQDPSGRSWAKESANATFIYSNTPPGSTTMAAQAIAITGNGQPHENMQPFLVLNFCIALVGDLPIAELSETGSKDIVLRPAAASDELFLRHLFATTREPELAALPPEFRTIFLQHQFEAQRVHYHTYFPDATHDIILRGDNPVGRLWVDRQMNHMLIVDIALIPEARGQGIGTGLLGVLIREAASASKVLQIHVEQFNPALRLYERLGFRTKGEDGVYFLMEREPL